MNVGKQCKATLKTPEYDCNLPFPLEQEPCYLSWACMAKKGFRARPGLRELGLGLVGISSARNWMAFHLAPF